MVWPDRLCIVGNPEVILGHHTTPQLAPSSHLGMWEKLVNRAPYHNTLFDTLEIAARRLSLFYALPGPSGEPFDTSANGGRFGQPFWRCSISPVRSRPQELERAQPKSVNPKAHKHTRKRNTTLVLEVLERRPKSSETGRASGHNTTEGVFCCACLGNDVARPEHLDYVAPTSGTCTMSKWRKRPESSPNNPQNRTHKTADSSRRNFLQTAGVTAGAVLIPESLWAQGKHATASESQFYFSTNQPAVHDHARSSLGLGFFQEPGRSNLCGRHGLEAIHRFPDIENAGVRRRRLGLC